MSITWTTEPLARVLTERKETPSEAALASGEIPIVAKVGFDDGKIYLRTGSETKTGMILVRPGDLLVSGINAAKGSIAIYDKKNSEPIAATIHYGAYIPIEERVDVSFLWWLLRSGTFKELLLRHVPGGIKTELKAKRLLAVPIPLPSPAEQRRIVERIETLSAKIAEARGLRCLAAQETEALFASAISNVMNGIGHDRRLSDVLTGKPRNGWSARCDNVEGGVAVLSLGAVTGFTYRANQYKTTSEATDANAHYWLRPGDLLITRSNTPELVGHAAIYDGSPFPCIYPDLMMRVEVDETRADAKFLHRWIQSTTVRDYIARNAKGTSPTMKKVSQGIVMDIPFPSHLSTPEQRRIVAYLDGVQAKVDAMRRLQAETAAELDALLPAILHRAFRGEL